jgi:septum formation protein
MKLILASGSPRRAEILRAAGFSFEVVTADVDETLHSDEAPADYVRRLAEAKARAAAQIVAKTGSAPSAILIAADTTVVAGGEILAKPESPEGARRMLETLSGRTHEVYTGVALLRVPDGELRVFDAVTHVEFAKIAAGEITDYIATGEPFGKAGGYGIQGRAGKFVNRIDGCYFNVMGLPLSRVYAELCKIGWSAANQRNV